MDVTRPVRPVKQRSMSESALWLLVAKAVGLSFMFVLPVLLVRHLSQHEFGVYKQVFLVVGTAVSLLPLGFGMSAFYFLPRTSERRGRVVVNILLVYVGIALVAAGVLTYRPDVLASLFNDPALPAYGPAIALIILLWMPSNCLETLAVADGDAALASRFIVLLQLSRAVFLVTAAWVAGSVWALIVAAILQGLVQTAVLVWYLATRFTGCWRAIDWSMMRDQLAYGLPFGAATLLYWFQTDLHRYVVAHHFDAATYAIYTIGCFELPLLGILNESVGAVLIPRMSELQRDGRSHDIIRLAAGAMRKLAAVHLPAYAMLTVAGPQLIVLLFTSQYAAAWPIFAINLVLIPFSLPTIPCDAVIRAHAEHRYFLVRLRLVSLAMLLLGLWVALDRFGLVGAITVVVLVNLFERAASTVKAARIVGMTRADIRLFEGTARILGASAIAAGVAYFSRSAFMPGGPAAVVLGSSAVLGLAYIVLLLIFKIPTDSERTALAGLGLRVRALGRTSLVSSAIRDSSV